MNLESLRSGNYEGTRSVFQHDVIDSVRKLTYPLALAVFFALNPHAAEAINIKQDATLAEGIDRLRQGALSDKVETRAEYIALKEGDGLWISQEGTLTSVGTTFEDYVLSLQRALDTILAKRGDTVTVHSFHTHPIKAALSVGFGSSASDRLISVPPSNGYLNMGGDTAAFKHNQFQNKVLNPVSRNNGVTIVFLEHVVDPLGVWTYGQFSDTELAKYHPVVAEEHKHAKEIIGDMLKQKEFLEQDSIVGNYVANQSEADIDRIITNARLTEDGIFEVSEISKIADVGKRLERKREFAAYVIETGEVNDGFKIHNEHIMKYLELKRASEKILREGENLRKEIDTLILRWTKVSQKEDIIDMVHSDLYTKLRFAYAKARIKLSFKPFAVANTPIVDKVD